MTITMETPDDTEVRPDPDPAPEDETPPQEPEQEPLQTPAAPQPPAAAR